MKTKDIIDVVLKSGQKVHQEINRIYDGKEHPVTGVGITSGGTEICQQIDASTRKITQKRDRKVVSEITSTISADGKTLTNRRTTGDVKDVRVFERR